MRRSTRTPRRCSRARRAWTSRAAARFTRLPACRRASLLSHSPNAAFAPRCPRVREGCRSREPALESAGDERLRRCIIPIAELAAKP